MSNELEKANVTHLDKLTEIAQMNTYNISSMNQQMGIFKMTIDKHEERIMQLERNDMLRSQNERLDLDQRRRLYSAVHLRAGHILKIVDENGNINKNLSDYKKYYGKFCSKCFRDSQKHSYCGIPYSETKMKDYEAVMDYVSKWEPEISWNGNYGTNAYKDYLDDLQKA